MTTTTEQTTTAPDLEAVRLELEAGRPSSGTVRWLHAGIASYLAGEARSLDHALGLAVPGRPSPLTQHRRRQRNDALRDAYSAIDGATERERLEALVTTAKRFECGKWLRWAPMTEPPPSATDLERALFRALDTGQPLPYSRTQLREIVAGEPGDSSRPDQDGP